MVSSQWSVIVVSVQRSAFSNGLVLAIVMLLFASACSSRASDTAQVPTPTQLPAIPATATFGPQSFASNVSPVPTPTAYLTRGDTLTVNLKTNFQTRLLLGMDQKLVIIPPEEWGDDGWDVAFDEQFLQLDPQIDEKHPPLTGWIWTPKQTGQTRLRIVSIVPCRNYNPPCGMPEFGGFIDVTIVEHVR